MQRARPLSSARRVRAVLPPRHAWSIVADNPTNTSSFPVLSEDVTHRNGEVLDDAAQAQLIALVAVTDDGHAEDVDPRTWVPTDAGTYDYATGNAVGSVNVPTGARIKRVIAIPSTGGAVSVKIIDKPTMSLPAGWAFDEQIPGTVLGTSSTTDVVIGGQVAFYYVSWVL